MLFIFESPHKSRRKTTTGFHEQLADALSNMPPDLRVANQVGRKDRIFVSTGHVSLVVMIGIDGKGLKMRPFVIVRDQ
jgi:hypothetical protein